MWLLDEVLQLAKDYLVASMAAHSSAFSVSLSTCPSLSPPPAPAHEDQGAKTIIPDQVISMFSLSIDVPWSSRLPLPELQDLKGGSGVTM